MPPIRPIKCAFSNFMANPRSCSRPDGSCKDQLLDSSQFSSTRKSAPCRQGAPFDLRRESASQYYRDTRRPGPIGDGRRTVSCSPGGLAEFLGREADQGFSDRVTSVNRLHEFGIGRLPCPTLQINAALFDAAAWDYKLAFIRVSGAGRMVGYSATEANSSIILGVRGFERYADCRIGQSASGLSIRFFEGG